MIIFHALLPFRERRMTNTLVLVKLHARETSCEPDNNGQANDRKDDVFKNFEVIVQLLLATV